MTSSDFQWRKSFFQPHDDHQKANTKKLFFSVFALRNQQNIPSTAKKHNNNNNNNNTIQYIQKWNNSSQPDAAVPRQEFIKDFHIKYYQRDYRTKAAHKDAYYANSEVVFRQEVFKKPYTIIEGEPVGPFYGFGMENKTSYVMDERDNKQVYSHKKSLNLFRPEDVKEKEEDVIAQMEQDLTYHHHHHQGKK